MSRSGSTPILCTGGPVEGIGKLCEICQKILLENFVENNLLPDPTVGFPVSNISTVTYVKPTIKNKNIIVGDFTYFSDVDFENHVIHFYEFYDDTNIYKSISS